MNTIQVKKEKQLHTTALIDALTFTYNTYAQKNMIHKHPAVFLKGQPGVGKSQAVYKISQRLKQSQNKQVRVIDVRLLMFNPVDLRGIPIADIQTQTAIWLKPYIFKLDPSNDMINILFLDELTSAPQSIQAAAYQIALDRRIGEHELPDNTFIIAAGNRAEDEALTYEMPSALKNRFMHFEVINHLEHWLEWAKQANIHEDIIQFIQVHPQYFVSESMDTPSNIIITPRTWEMLSNMIQTLGGSLQDHETYVASFIGEHLAHIMLHTHGAIKIEDILEKRIRTVPQDASTLQQVVELLEATLDQYVFQEQKLNTVFHFLSTLPPDFAVRVFKQIVKRQDIPFKVTDLDGYQIMISLFEQMSNA